MRLAGALLALALLPGGPARAAARARDGGTFALAILPEVAADVAGETPEGATLHQLYAAPLCRLEQDGRVEPLLATFQRTPEGLMVSPRPGTRFASGSPLTGAQLAQSWQRGLARNPVVRAALAPLGNQRGAVLDPQGRAAAGAPLLLPLAHPWPDFEASLCHPALSPELGGLPPPDGVGPYGRDGRAVLEFPAGRPHPDVLATSTLPRRAALRALQQRSIQAALGEAGDGSGPALFATYLLYRRGKPLGPLVASRLDRAALVRSFVPAPSVAMPGLLPPALGGPSTGPAPAPGARGSGSAVLLYTKDRPVQRAVAERLQILLRDAGVQLTLSAREPAALDAAWRDGDGDLALRSMLLPPLAAPALAVVLDLAEAYDIGPRELAALGSVAEPEARAARTRARALELAPSLNVIPLFAEGPRARFDPALVDVRRDGFGLFVLDDAWWP